MVFRRVGIHELHPTPPNSVPAGRRSGGREARGAATPIHLESRQGEAAEVLPKQGEEEDLQCGATVGSSWCK